MLHSPEAINAVKCGTFQIENLWTEVTRRCNFACEHCYHGPAQKLSMSEETMDAILEHLQKNLIKRINLTGGEYNTDLNSLHRFYKALQKNKTKFEKLGLVTNGVKIKNEFFMILDEIAKLSTAKKVKIEMSNDKYHLKQYEEHDLNYEQNLTSFMTMALQYPRINAKTRESSSGNSETVVNIGNAKKLHFAYKNSAEKQNTKNLTFKLSYNPEKHCCDKVLLTHICFDAKGNITPLVSEYDAKGFGNIHKNDMTQIYLTHGKDI